MTEKQRETLLILAAGALLFFVPRFKGLVTTSAASAALGYVHNPAVRSLLQGLVK